MGMPEFRGGTRSEMSEAAYWLGLADAGYAAHQDAPAQQFFKTKQDLEEILESLSRADTKIKMAMDGIRRQLENKKLERWSHG